MHHLSSLSPCRPESRWNVSATSRCCYLQLQKAHAPACTSSPNVLPKGMELSTGVGWFTYVIISPNVAHSFSLFYARTSLSQRLYILSPVVISR